MRDELIAYLLNDLSKEQRSRIEARLESDPIWQHELERLNFYINASSEAPPEEEAQEPLPRDLVDSTCSFVKKATSQGEVLEAAPVTLSESKDTIGDNRRWSFTDFSVTAGILLILAAMLIPALQKSRDSARRVQCQAKLRGLGAALASYAERFQGELPRIERGENVGMFVVKLADSGFLTREELTELLVCPSTELADDIFSGKVTLHIPTREELADADRAKLLVIRKNMAGSYAYRLGYFDPAGRYHHVRFTGRSSSPLLSDAPSFSVVGFQSDNHDGYGQNVMFQDMSIRYVPQYSPTGKDDHLFLNQEKQHAAGCDESDIVLGRSEIDPWAVSGGE